MKIFLHILEKAERMQKLIQSIFELRTGWERGYPV